MRGSPRTVSACTRVCSATSRLLVHRSIAPELIDRLRDAVECVRELHAPLYLHEVVKRVFAQYSVEEFFQKRAQISEQIRKEVKQTDVFKLMFLQDCCVTKFEVVQA